MIKHFESYPKVISISKNVRTVYCFVLQLYIPIVLLD